MLHRSTHPVHLTGSCPRCGGPGGDLADGGDETACSWCAATFVVPRLEWWCTPCGAWLRSKPGRGLGAVAAAPNQADPPAPAVCGRIGCGTVINRGRVFYCGELEDDACPWGCGGFFCIPHLGSHECSGFEDLSMHLCVWAAGEPACEWDGDPWPCAAVRADPDNPTIGALRGGAA